MLSEFVSQLNKGFSFCQHFSGGTDRTKIEEISLFIALLKVIIVIVKTLKKATSLADSYWERDN